MKYTYKNLKHVILHGMQPGETKTFDHEILGGGIELVTEKKKIKKINKEEDLNDSKNNRSLD